MTRYLDVTNTFLFWHGSPTGIQRVIQGLSLASEKKGFQLAVFHPSSRTWYSLSPQVMETTFQPDVFVKSNRKLKALLGSSAKILQPIYRSYVHKLGLKMGRQARERLLLREGKQVHFQAGDQLHLVDVNWDLSAEFFSAIREERKKQPALDVVGFIYDICPLTHPQFVTDDAFAETFSSWITPLVEESSWLLTDSKDAAREVVKVFGGRLAKHRFPPRAVRFGSKLAVVPSNTPPPSPKELLSKIEACGFLLTPEQKQSLLESEGWAIWVGLMHPRKNLDVQINGLDPLWQSGKIKMPLFWVGRMGGGSGDLLHRVTKTPHLKTNVIRLESAPDSLLWELFRGARFSFYTSWTEGFGLPVSESLQFGCPVIASSGGPIPEVAGDLVEYFEPWDARGLQELVLKYLRDPKAYEKTRENVKKFVPYTWEDTLDDLSRTPSQTSGSSA